MGRRALALVLFAWVAGGCAPSLPALRNRSPVETALGGFRVDYADADSQASGQVTAAIELAGPTIARWGRLSKPVVVSVLPTHAELEHAIKRSGYDWLRAWARYDEVYVQSPLTWSAGGAAQSDVNELMLHELTHCVMYQIAANSHTWTHLFIPLW